MNYFNLIFNILPKKQKSKIYKVLIINFISIILEILSIGLIIPFLIFITGQKNIFLKIEHFSFLNEIDDNKLIIYTIILLVIIFTIKNLYLSISLRYNSKYIYNSVRDLSNYIFYNYLKKPFTFFMSVNSSILIRNVIQDVNNFGISILFSTINLVVEFFIIFGLSIILIIYNPQIYFLVTIPGLLFVFLIYNILKSRLQKWGDISHKYTAKKLKNTKQGIEGIKEIIINQAQEKFFSIFSKDNQLFVTSDIKRWIYLNFPRFLIEVFMVYAFASIIFFMYFMNFDNNSIISTLGLFAAVAFRLTPSFLRITNSLNLIKFHKPILLNLDNEIKSLKQDNVIIKNTDIIYNFDNKIEIQNLFFKYNQPYKEIFQNSNFEIFKGDKIGIYGASGSGKSTFVDLVTGLNLPASGDIKVDGISIYESITNWQRLIGYVSQKTYIIDGSIKSNITFELENTVKDNSKIIEILKIVELYDFVNTLKNNIDEQIGENGIKLSGGQIQRLSLARALYRNPKILIMDESTNALDSVTEEKILNNLSKSNLFETLIFITHKINSLKFCNKIFELKDRNFHVKNYEEKF